MNASDALGHLLVSTHRFLESLQAPPLAPFLAEWPGPGSLFTSHADNTGIGAHRATLSSLPVLRWLPRIACAADVRDAQLIAALSRAAPSLEWRQTYSTREVGVEFLQNYAWCEILGPESPRSGLRIACGFLLLGPDTLYPRHRHAAEEIYLPLSGTAHWQQGDGNWRPRAPGELLHHLSEEPHAMRTAGDPLLALYLWRGAALSQHARLD